MAEASARVVVGIDTILRGLPKTVKDIATLRSQLTSLSKIKAPVLGKASTTNFDKAALAAQKQKVQIQELANRQERARQAADRLAQSQRRLAESAARLEAAQKRQAQTSERVAAASGKQADSHIKVFRVTERARLAQERFEKAAAASLQRQRSSALIKQFQDQERAATRAARTREREAKRAADAEIREARRADRLIEQSRQKLIGAFRGIGSTLTSIGTALTAGITAPLTTLGLVSVKSAKDVDSQVNTLKAFTGSAEAAEQRLADLIATAQKTPGLTTSLGLVLDSQLRLAKVTVETIDKVLPAIGRLNAVSKLEDPQRFAQNLAQLVSQNFERTDLKELVGQSPVAGQIIQELFNVSSPTNSEAIREAAKKMGLTTTDAFFAAFAEAASRNQALVNVTESISSRFGKAVDRVVIALRPLGLELIDAITPAINALVPIIERLGNAFSSLPKPAKTAIVVLAGLLAAAGPALLALGGLVGVIGSVASGITAFASAAAAVGGVVALLTGIGEVLLVVVAVLAVATAAGIALFKAWESNFGGIRDTVTRALNIIQEGFNRVLPNILSLTEKVTKGIHAFWQRFGPRITAIVEAVFGVLVRRTEAVIEVITNMVVLVAKLIDGDWRGAWEAFKRILEAGIRATSDLVGTFIRVIGLAVDQLIKLLLAAVKKFVEVGTKFAKNVLTGFVVFLSSPEAAARAVSAIVDFLLSLPSKVKDIAFEMGKRMGRTMSEGFAEGIVGGTKDIPPLTVPDVKAPPAPIVAPPPAPPPPTTTDKKGESAIRNAQESLNRARAERQKAADDQLIEQERIKNEQLLTANENTFRLQLIAYRQYLNERARLTSANIQLEIKQQKQVAEQALSERDRLLARAATKGVPRAERLRAEAGAAEADAKRIQALTTINRLEADQRALVTEVNQALAEAQQQQEKDIRDLQIVYGQLTGRIEESLNAATDAAIEERLKALAQAQKDLSERLQIAKEIGDADAQAQIENAQRINQAEIETLKNKNALERATNLLAAAEKFVTESKEKQAQLEQQIAFDVEFRGLKEEEAIRRRLAGEDALKQRLLIARDIIQDTVDALRAKQIKPPQTLIDFLTNTELAIKGLAELPLTEQFRRAQQEFERLNDERLRRIADVERAVRGRDIAEAEGAILIRRINGEKVAALEAQLALMKEIASRVGKGELRDQFNRQVTGATETIRDAKDELAGLSRQIETAGKDAFRSGLTNFFSDILNRTKSAKEAVLDFLNSIFQRINDVIAENLSKKLFESIFGGVEGQGEGLIAKIRSIFGGADVEGGTEVAITAAKTAEGAAAATAITTGATVAATALTSGGTGAGAAMTGGGAAAAAAMTTAGAALSASLLASGASFSAAVIAAGAAFAAAVAAAAASQSAASFAGALPFASGGQVPINVSRGELYVPPSAVNRFGPTFWNQLNAKRLRLSEAAGILRGPGTGTSDSIAALAPERSFILRADAVKYYSDLFLRRINSRRMAEGGIVSSIPDAELDQALGGGAASSQAPLNLRVINQLDAQRIGRAYLSSEQGVRDVLNVISNNSNEIVRRLPIRR